MLVQVRGRCMGPRGPEVEMPGEFILCGLWGMLSADRNTRWHLLEADGQTAMGATPASKSDSSILILFVIVVENAEVIVTGQKHRHLDSQHPQLKMAFFPHLLYVSPKQ